MIAGLRSLDPRQRRRRAAPPGRPRRRRSRPPGRAGVRSSALTAPPAPARGRGRARARRPRRRARAASRIAGQNSAWAAPITASSISSASMPRRRDRRDEIVCAVRGLHLALATLQRSDWPGSCKRAPARIPPPRKAESGRNRGLRPRVCLSPMPVDRDEKPHRPRLGAARRRRLPVRRPGRRRRARRRRLGAAARRRARPDRGNPAGLLPGQNRQQRRDHALPGRGSRDRLPGDRRRRRPPVRGALRRQDRRLVDHPRQALDQRNRRRPPNEVGFFNEFLGQPSQARIGILRPVEDSKPPKYTLVRQSPLRDPQPLLRHHPDLRPRPPADRPQGPGRRPHDPDLGADVRLQRRRRQHLARQPPARALRLQGRHPGRPSRSRASARPRPTAATTRNARLLYTATLVKKP